MTVATGPSVNRLSTVASAVDPCAAHSRLRFTASAGQTYWIAVAGIDAAGEIRMEIRRDG